MQFNRKYLSDEKLVQIYKNLLLPRMIEEKMLVLLRQGKISKWFSGIGQEAIAVGSTLALEQDEWIMPLHRNLGVFTSRGLPLHQLFLQWQGFKNSYSKGRERSFHFGSKKHHICGMISHLGPQLAVADGVALAQKLRKENKISLAYSGDGGTSEGDFHEALNVAAVWNLPVIFIIENNGYALSTPVNEQYRCKNLADKARGYGMEGITIEGNNVLTVYDTIKGVREYCIKNQKPYLIECTTFRIRGHEEASGTKYVPKELLEEWGKKDPVKNYEQWLVKENILNEMQVADNRNECRSYIEEELLLASQAQETTIDTKEELLDVYAGNTLVYPLSSTTPQPGVIPVNKGGGQPVDIQQGINPVTTEGRQPEKRFVDAIKEGLHQSMQRHPNLILMGQDIAEYGGAFKITEGFVYDFGRERVRNTPLCETLL
jgi:2-oxoisovalerate dehydrogenase E1 component